MSVRWLSIAACMFAFTGLTNPASAAPTAAQIKQSLRTSTWCTTYTAANGKKVQANIRFNGSRGTFGSNGRLSNIVYAVDTTTNPGRPFFQITGDWSKGGVSGQFLFGSSNGLKNFVGSWNDENGNNGRWTGWRMK